MTSWLQKQKKVDLHTLATEAGLTNTTDLKKDDLIAALDDHLHANASSLKSNSSFAEYYRTTRRPLSDPDTNQPKRRRVTNVTPKVNTDTSPERESTIANAAASAAATVTNAARTPQTQRAAARVPFPPSPAVVADFADRQTEMLTRRIRKYLRESTITEKVESLRESVSSVTVISLLFLAVEFYGLQRVTLPWRYAFTVPGTQFTSPVPIKLPDLFILLTGSFWSPTTLWIITSLVLPLVAGSLINLTAANEGRATRRRPGHSTIDLFAFNLARAVFAWLVFSKGFRLGGLIDSKTVVRVEAAVPGGWFGIVIGSLIGVLASLYDAILKK